MMVVSSNHRGTRCGPKSLGGSMSERDQRYASDVTDAEWALIEPHVPAAKPLGRPREIELRALLDAILYRAKRL
jgi:hypothetical protein